MKTQQQTIKRTQQSILRLTLLSTLVAQAYAQEAPAPATSPAATISDAAAPVTSIKVTGYRAALQTSTNEKRNSTGFTDAVFAEDIGKFPDSNIAESLNRIPGIQISRNIAGEGTNVQIRGLGATFTKVLLNGAPIAIANSSGADRGVDLDLLPTDLFTKLTVSKSPFASQVEGGASGVVDIRSARPFDKKGEYIAVSVDGRYNSYAEKVKPRASILASKTWGDTFGLLGGIAYTKDQRFSRSYETVGWTNPALTAAQSSSPIRNSTGGGNWTIPATVPVGAGAGLIAGTPINQAFLLANNPGTSIDAIDNGLVPRLSRPMTNRGDRNQLTGIISAEYRPTNDLHFYVDTLYSRRTMHAEQTDMNFAVRSSAVIPLSYQVDRSDCSNGCVVNSATFANAQSFLEYRMFSERGSVFGINPGMEWQITDKLKLDASANSNQSHYHQTQPVIIVHTPSGVGTTVKYDNTGDIPNVTSSIDVNNPANFTWSSGLSRVQIQDEERSSNTKGARANLTWGDKSFTVKVGASFDQWKRRLVNYDNSIAYQAAVCGNNPNMVLLAPNTMAACDGASTPSASAAPLFPGYGTGYTATSITKPTYQGSLVPVGSVQNYLKPGPDGYVTLDWNKWVAATNYNYYHDTTVVATTALSVPAGYIGENIGGLYIETSGTLDVFDKPLRYDAGVRYARTRQSIGTFSSFSDPRNVGLANGARYPDITQWVYQDRTYGNALPSASLAYNLRKDLVLRSSISRTMTRASPDAMRPGITFNSPSADVGSIGNSKLNPYLSDNLDLGVEWYTGREGYVSATLFHKRISGLTISENVTLPFSALADYGVTYDSLLPQQQTALNLRGGPNSATVVMSTTRNALGHLNVDGVEMGWVQPLDKWLPIRGFGFNENFTYVKQKASGEGTSTFVALGVPARSNNLTVYYEKDGYMARLSETYSSGFQSAGLNQNGVTQAGLFREAYKQVDFSSSIDLDTVLNRDGWPTIAFNIANMNNARQKYTFQYSNAAYQVNTGGRTYSLGLRMKF
ncbi:MAG TPA: TonB-dependent receptor [Paraburkholderia sp.]|uniref:TonB-dependent receptor n=1 Tax=Paraburkholderia sp. TaxID=1926495 RepID=UPI002B4A8B85|nr:TonB-dependent receptor [Paraburkholderia sp.]HKR39436.1 TonB-dependent receptor [Paraburkholderia sp.]